MALALEGRGAEQSVRKRFAGCHRHPGSPPRRYVLAAHPLVGENAHRESDLGLAGSGRIANVESTTVRADAGHGDLEGGDLDAADGR